MDEWLLRLAEAPEAGGPGDKTCSGSCQRIMVQAAALPDTQGRERTDSQPLFCWRQAPVSCIRYSELRHRVATGIY